MWWIVIKIRSQLEKKNVFILYFNCDVKCKMFWTSSWDSPIIVYIYIKKTLICWTTICVNHVWYALNCIILKWWCWWIGALQKSSLNYITEHISNKAKPINLCGPWIFTYRLFMINPSIENTREPTEKYVVDNRVLLWTEVAHIQCIAERN